MTKTIKENYFVASAVRGRVMSPNGNRAGLPTDRPIAGEVSQPSPLNTQVFVRQSGEGQGPEFGVPHSIPGRNHAMWEEPTIEYYGETNSNANLWKRAWEKAFPCSACNLTNYNTNAWNLKWNDAHKCCNK
jgi:hypothetical protein